MAGAALASGLVGQANATPPIATTGLLNFLGNTTVGQGPTLGTFSCPATPPDDCQTRVTTDGQYAPVPVAGRWWVMPGDNLTVTAGFVGCYPTGPVGGQYSWKAAGFSNPAQEDGDIVTGWQFGGAPVTTGVTTLPSSISSVPTTTTVLLSNLTAADDGKDLMSVGPQSSYDEPCNRRVQQLTVSGAGVAHPVRVFNPRAALSKEVCMAFDSAGTACTQWGKGPAAYLFGQTVMWRITVTNTGNVDIANVKIENDELSSSQFPTLNGTGSCQGAAVVNLGDPSLGATIHAPGAGAPNTDKAALTCTTGLPAAPVGGVTSGTVTNTAQAAGNPVDPSGDGSIASRFKDGIIEYRTEPDSASATIEYPHLTLKKYACHNPDGDGTGLGCQVPTAIKASTPDELRREMSEAGWMDTEDSGVPVEVKDGASVAWLVVAQNTGTVDLSDVTLSSDTLTAAGEMARPADANTCIRDAHAISLAVGQMAPLATCTSTGVTATESPLVNTATATGVDTFASVVSSNEGSATVTVTPPTPVTPPDNPDTPPTTPPPSPSTPIPPPTPALPPTGGQVSGGGGTLPATGPAIYILKQACTWGTGCDVKNDADWAAVTTQPAGKAVTWRIVIANVGTEPLTDEKVTDALSGTRSGSERSCQLASGSADVLRPGYEIAYLCASSPLAQSESGLVNSAKVTAKGVQSGTVIGTKVSSATVLVEAPTPTALPLTGFTSLGLGALALLLMACGGLGLRRTWV